MINSHVAEWHSKPVAACAESSDCVVVVILLLISMCVCLKEAGAARGHIKQCCWTLLCVNVYTALTPQPIPSVFMSFIDPAHYMIRKYLKILNFTQSVIFSVLASLVELFSINIYMHVPEFHPRQTNWFSVSAEVHCK